MRQRQLPNPKPAEWVEVEARWDHSTWYFTGESAKREATEYAKRRLQRLISHPTAGPKVNGAKLRGDALVVEWVDRPENQFAIGQDQKVTRILSGRLGHQLGRAPWWFNGFVITATYIGPEYLGPTKGTSCT